MGSLKTNIIFVFLAILNFANSDLPNGALCYLKNGSSGTCVEISSCPEIRNQLARREISRSQVTICNKPKRFLCCPLPPDQEETTIKQVFLNANQGERISERKCKEYAKKVLQKVLISSLIISEQRHETTTSKCQHKATSLIVGGTEASKNEFPHQALLGYLNGISIEWNCGGSLVSPRFVLTAAHCFNHADFGPVKFAKLGMHNRVHNEDKTYTFGVEERFRHPNYLKGSFNNDIGLLKLDGIVPLDEHILPICMPTEKNDNIKAMATGFGKTRRKHQSDVLMKVTLEKFDHSECQSSWGEDSSVRIDEHTMLCYGHHTENKDSCRGDSGGPLQVPNEQNVHCTYTQIGIISFGPATCAQVGVARGDAARLYEFPHQALLGYQKTDKIEWLCGGSLISPDFVLTAAHCTNSLDHGVVKLVKFAVYDRTYDTNATTISTIKEIFKHSRGRLASLHNDIALLKLQTSIETSEFILPACLPTRPYHDAKAMVTGFGDNGRGTLTQHLMKVVIEKFDHKVCNNMYEDNYNETTMLCYGHQTERKDSCQGDSGGPLQVNNEEVHCTYTIIGIVSYGPKICGIIGAAGAYINVYKYLDWIEGIVWKNEI